MASDPRESSGNIQPEASGQALSEEAQGKEPTEEAVSAAVSEQADGDGAGVEKKTFDRSLDEPWEKVVAGYEREARALGEDEAAAPLWYETGIIQEERLGRTKPAAVCFRTAFHLDPTWRPNIHAARRLYTEVGNWPMVAKLLQSEADATDDPSAKADLLFERAVLLHEKMDRSAEAVALLARVEELAPCRLFVLKYIEGLAARGRDYQRLAEVCLQEAEAADSLPFELALLCLAGGLFAGRVGDSSLAIQAYAKALELEPKHSVALAALDHLYAASGDHEARLEVLEAQAKQTDSEAEAAAAWQEAARLAEECLGRRDEAIGFLEEGRAQAPRDPTLLSELAHRYEAAGTVEPLAETLVQLSEVTEDPGALGELHLKLGSLLDDLDRSEEAAGAYRKALDARPGDPAALAALGKLYFRARRWEDLIWTFEQEMLGTQDAKQRASRGFKIAEIQEQRLDRPEDAAETLKKILAEAPGYLPAVQALTRLYETSGRWEDMIALLESEAEETEDVDQKVALLERIARVREERLEDPEAAAETWERALTLKPRHLPSVRSLARLYRKLERWRDLIRCLEQEADQVDDQRQVIALLHQVAELYDERVEDREAAIAAYRKVLGLQPNYLPALKALGRLCEQAGRWQELIDMFRMELEVTRSTPHLVSLLMKIGEIQERRLDQQEQAVAAYKEVLDEKPDSLVALRALERLHTRREDWDAVVDVLREQAEVLKGPVEKALMLTRAAGILEWRSGDTEKAVATYERALAALPDHAPALRAVTRLHAAAGSWPSLAECYGRLLDGGDPMETLEIRRRLGLLHLERLGESEAARECFEAVLRAAPDDALSLAALDILHTASGEHEAAIERRKAMADGAGSGSTAVGLLRAAAVDQENLLGGGEAAEALWERLYELAPNEPTVARRAELFARRSGDRAKLAAVYESQLESAKGDDVRLALAMRLGELALEEPAELESAEAAFRQALDIAPHHLPAIRGLKRALAASGRWDEVQGLLELEGEISKDPERAVTLLFEAGVLREEHLEDLAAAERNYQKVLERDPTEIRAYDRLTRLLESQDRHGELAELHAWRAGVSRDPKARAEACMAAARLQAGPLENPPAALSSVEKALASDPARLDAVELGAELSFRLESWEKAAVLCQQRLELGGEPPRLVTYRLRLALLHHEHLGAPERAIACLQDVIGVEPKNKEALRRLADIHTSGGNWAAAADALSRLADAEAEPERRVPVLMQLAGLHAERRGDRAAAISTLEYVRVLDAGNIEAIKRLGKLHEAASDWESVVRTYCDYLEVMPKAEREKAFPLYVRMAELQSGPLKNPTKAIQSYRAAIELRPEDNAPRIALAALLAKDPSFQSLAVEEHCGVLEVDPFRLESYHALFDLFVATKQFERAWVVTAILHFLKACTEEESFFHTDNKSRTPAAAEGSLAAEDIAQLLRHEDDSGALADVMTVIGNQLSRVYPPDLARLQVGRSERLSPKDGSPLRRMCDALAGNLGGVDFELYRADRVPDALDSFPADPPILVVGPDFIRRHPVKAQRFLLARLLSGMSMGTLLALRLGREELASTIQAAVQVAMPDFDGLGARPDADLSKRCGKSMARRARKALEEPAAALRAAGDSVDIGRFKEGVKRTSERAGLLLSADIATGLGLLAAEAGKRSVEDPATELRGVTAVEEALRFYMSEAFYRLRQKLKLSF